MILTDFFKIDGKILGINELPDFSKRIFYIDVGHFIKKEAQQNKVKRCTANGGRLSNTRFCKGANKYAKYIQNNPQVESQFEYAIREFSTLLNKLSESPFDQKMLSPEDRIYEIEKLTCQATEPFKHWDSVNKICDWNVCFCDSPGTVIHPHSCPKHNMQGACTVTLNQIEMLNLNAKIKS